MGRLTVTPVIKEEPVEQMQIKQVGQDVWRY